MPDLRHTLLKVQWPDSPISSGTVAAEEWEEWMALVPAANINLGDEEGNFRKDTVTFEEIKSSSHATLDSLFKAWSQLRNIVANYETTLQNRWLKKSPKQRTEILLQAWPKMSCVHRPDLDLFCKERKTKGYHQKNRVTTDIALRFPFINTEDLSQPKPLLLMLDSRSRNFPCVFANADRDTIRVGIRSKMLVPKYIRGYTMFLNGEQTREGYGRLVSWEEDRQAIFKCHRGIAPDPGTGLILLEIQRDTLGLLVACSIRILHDKFSSSLVGIPIGNSSDTADLLTTSQPQKMTVGTLNTGYDSVTAHALEAPYRVPDAYDFRRLRNFVQAKCHEVEDHFLFVREDPAYFAELMREACNHTNEATVNRKYDPCSTRLSDTAWNEALFRVLVTTYSDMFLWQAVSRLFDQLVTTYTEQRGSILPGKILSNAYMAVFSRLGNVLDSITQMYLENLLDYMAAVPTFKQQIIHMNQPNERVLVTIKRKSEMQRQMGLSTCNEYTLSSFSDEENNAWCKNHVGPLPDIHEVLYHSIRLAQANGDAPLVTDLRVFEYPSDRPRTAANTAKMRSAEHALDILWEKVDERFVRKTRKTLKELGEGKIQHRDIQRTPSWTHPQLSVIERGNIDRSTEELDASRVLSILEERTESTIEFSKPSVACAKVKTRGLPINPAYLEQTDQGSTSAEKSQRLSVRKKAFDTFAALFRKPLLGGKLPGEIPWTDFKKAMVNVGFGAEKLQGSGWLFESKHGSIIFHEPHPQSKLPMQWARRIARRLNRNFGWTAETFVLEVGMENNDDSSKIA